MASNMPSDVIDSILHQLKSYADPKRALVSVRFFKEVKDIFWGIRVPDIRKVAQDNFCNADLGDVQSLLNSEVHEVKTLSLEMLVLKFERARKSGDQKSKKAIVDFYFKHSKKVNDWDLVDTSASYIVGEYFVDEGVTSRQYENLMQDFILSKNIWQRRIAIISTHAFIRKGDIDAALWVAKILLKDPEDLIHKAVGWTLREAWKKNKDAVENFIKKNYDDINRTTLRYAIERISSEKRQKILKKIF